MEVALCNTFQTISAWLGLLLSIKSSLPRDLILLIRAMSLCTTLFCEYVEIFQTLSLYGETAFALNVPVLKITS